MYLRFSSSLICSATSSVGGAIVVVALAFALGLGVLLEEVLFERGFLRGERASWCCVDSATCVTTGDSAMFASARLAISNGEQRVEVGLGIGDLNKDDGGLGDGGARRASHNINRSSGHQLCGQSMQRNHGD